MISGSSAFSKTSMNIWKFKVQYCWSLGQESGFDGAEGQIMGLWFSGRLWVPSPGSRPPTSQGRAEPWRVSTAFPVRSGPVSSQSPRITASPRHPCSGPESPQVARGSHRGVKDPGEGKEERAEAPHRKKFREPARTQLPLPAPRPSQVHPGTHRRASG